MVFFKAVQQVHSGLFVLMDMIYINEGAPESIEESALVKGGCL